VLIAHKHALRPSMGLRRLWVIDLETCTDIHLGDGLGFTLLLLVITTVILFCWTFLTFCWSRIKAQWSISVVFDILKSAAIDNLAFVVQTHRVEADLIKI
jgi:hypothetical protein